MREPLHHVIASYDAPLAQSIKDGLLPHFPGGEFTLHDAHGPVPAHYADHVHEQERLQDSICNASILIVGVSGLRPNEYWAIESAVTMRKPCALIVKTENRATWAVLSLLHRLVDFRFIVSVGTLRGDKLKKLFPGAATVSDITSFTEPGKQIVDFIRQITMNAHVTRFKRSEDEGRGYEVLAS